MVENMDVDFGRKGVYVWDRLPCGLCRKGRSRAASKAGWQRQECGNWILYVEGSIVTLELEEKV